jgi:hypothetical protein
VPWAEATDIEDGIQVEVGRELKPIVKVFDPFEDFIWAELSRPKLRHFLVDFDILSCKPDHVFDIEDLCRSFVLFKLFLHPFLG